MEKRKIIVIALVGSCFIGLVLTNASLITVVTASQDLVIKIVHAVETGTSVLFYIFFIRGINPDCIEMMPDECVGTLQDNFQQLLKFDK